MLVGSSVAAVGWWRLGPVTRGTAWAEDGGIFLRQRLALGPAGSLLQPYAGFLHLVPRLVVDLAVARPIADYALTVTDASCAVVGVLGAAVFLLARDVVRSRLLRLLLAAVPALLPVAPFEIGGNATNLHWFVLFAVPWLFAHRARSWWAALAVAAITLAAVLTEVQAVVFLPLLGLAWAGWGAVGPPRVRLRALPVTLTALAGGAAQVAVALTTQRESPPGHPSFADVAVGYALQPLAGSWTSDLGAVGRALTVHGAAVLVVPVILLVVVVALASTVADGRARWLLLALGGGSVLVWTAALLANASADRGWATMSAARLATAEPSRYGAAAGLLLTSAVVVAAAQLTGASSRRPSSAVGRTGGAARVLRTALGWSVVAVVVVAAVANVAPGTTQRSAGPEWRPQIRSAVARCVDHPHRVVTVHTAPWGADVPCALVLRDR